MAAIPAPIDWGTLATLVGTSGLSGVLIAIIGYMKAAREGRPTPTVGQPGTVALATLYSEQAALHDAARSLQSLADAINAHAGKLDRFDERAEKFLDAILDIRRALEDLRPHRR